MHLVSNDWIWDFFFPWSNLKLIWDGLHYILLGLCKSWLFKCVLGQTGSTGPDGELRQRSPAVWVKKEKKKKEMESVTPVSSGCDKTKLLDVKEQGGGKQNTRKETAAQKESLIESSAVT